ncbi:hypothetical protein [Mesorhizobium sp. M0159]|uniref:hypothetical protein n=1 Tax=Mesorhizobium sp. M0159 TaxID=2956900 RepID=UPI003334DD08
MLALAPEIGQVSRREIADLVGVAPCDFDTGTFRGKRSIWGGRHDVRGVVYMVHSPPATPIPCSGPSISASLQTARSRRWRSSPSRERFSPSSAP